jgi:hypothetical protein
MLCGAGTGAPLACSGTKPAGNSARCTRTNRNQENEGLDYGGGTRSSRQEYVGYFLSGDFHEGLDHDRIKLST